MRKLDVELHPVTFELRGDLPEQLKARAKAESDIKGSRVTQSEILHRGLTRELKKPLPTNNRSGGQQ